MQTDSNGEWQRRRQTRQKMPSKGRRRRLFTWRVVSGSRILLASDSARLMSSSSSWSSIIDRLSCTFVLVLRRQRPHRCPCLCQQRKIVVNHGRTSVFITIVEMPSVRSLTFIVFGALMAI
jgi:hypothetical protein